MGLPVKESVESAGRLGKLDCRVDYLSECKNSLLVYMDSFVPITGKSSPMRNGFEPQKSVIWAGPPRGGAEGQFAPRPEGLRGLINEDF